MTKLAPVLGAPPVRDRVDPALPRVRAGDVVLDDRNWKEHPPEQLGVLRSLLGEVGIADVLLVRKREDGRLVAIDGHGRIKDDPERIWPYVVLDVTEEEAGRLILTLDPLASMAKVDDEKLRALLEEARRGTWSTDGADPLLRQLEAIIDTGRAADARGHAAKVLAGGPEAGWPEIRIAVSLELKLRFDALMSKLPGDAPWQRLSALLDRLG